MRTCPICLTKVAAGKIASSNDLECSSCKNALEVAPASRALSIAAGLAAAVLVWRLTEDSGSALGWVLPLVYAFLALSVVSLVVLMLLADLRIKSIEPARGAEHAAGPAPAHGSSHH